MPLIVHDRPFEAGDDDESQDVIITDGSGRVVNADVLFRKIRRSQKFREWDASKGTGVFEQHFTPRQLAHDWGVDVETIRNLFRDESGVVKIGDKNPKHKRAYLTLRIPDSVAKRVHRRISA